MMCKDTEDSKFKVFRVPRSVFRVLCGWKRQTISDQPINQSFNHSINPNNLLLPCRKGW